MTALGATALGGTSCGGGSAVPAGKRDGGGAGHAGGAGQGGVAGHDGGPSDAALCPGTGELAPEPALPRVALDGGVPLGQYAYAVAVARCSYWSRCFALSGYFANDCVDQLTTNNDSFNYPPSGATTRFFDPSDALLQAAAAGVVRYDSQREAECVAAELAEGCANSDLVQNLPACAGVFTCPPAADGGSGPTDGGAADGGPSCAQLIAGYEPLQTCSTDDDCAGVDADRQGPYCVAGICSQSRCGLFRSRVPRLPRSDSLASRTRSAFSTAGPRPRGCAHPGSVARGGRETGGSVPASSRSTWAGHAPTAPIASRGWPAPVEPARSRPRPVPA